MKQVPLGDEFLLEITVVPSGDETGSSWR